MFLDFHVAALCNLGFTICSSYKKQVWPALVYNVGCISQRSAKCFIWPVFFPSDISVICLVIKLKLAEEVFTSLEHWSYWLNFFPVISKKFRFMTENKVFGKRLSQTTFFSHTEITHLRLTLGLPHGSIDPFAIFFSNFKKKFCS